VRVLCCVAHLAETLLSTMQAANAATLAKLDARIAESEKNDGETEIRESVLARAEYQISIGEKEVAYAAIDETLTKTVAMGPRLDLLLAKLRVGLFFDDLLLAKTEVERAKGLLEQGGDWERRNRLKVYEALFLVRVPSTSVGASSLPCASSELS
jgi:26S proteasome regulatory subunit N7